MKARIIGVFTSKSLLRYSYVDTAKFRDDVDAVHHYDIKVPMMRVILLNEDGSLGDNKIMYASPDVVKTYTRVDFFKILKENNNSYLFDIETFGWFSWEIEYEMKCGEYPYLSYLVDCAPRDRLLSPIVDYPEISKIYKHEHF